MFDNQFDSLYDGSNICMSDYSRQMEAFFKVFFTCGTVMSSFSGPLKSTMPDAYLLTDFYSSVLSVVLLKLLIDFYKTNVIKMNKLSNVGVINELI